MWKAVGPFGDIDGGPAKEVVLQGKDDPNLGKFFELACGKHPAEELYDVAKDPYQLTNVADGTHMDFDLSLAGKRGAFDTVTLPGVEMSITKQEMAQAPTKGRSLDHIGFDVKNLEAFVKTLDAKGVKLDEAIRLAPNGTTKVAYLTDPWGTRIELTQNLAP